MASHDGDPRFYALIGDIVASRELPDRASVQRRFQASLEALNRGMAADLTAPLKLTAGDEVQALLHRPEAAVTIMVTLADALHPVHVAWGLGRGAISTDVTDDVSAMDGPCLHRARDAVRSANRRGTWLEVNGIPPPHGPVLSALMNLASAIRRDWTEKRARYVREARSATQREVARSFGVAESTVSEALSRAHVDRVLEAETAARELLRWFGAETGNDDTREEPSP